MSKSLGMTSGGVATQRFSGGKTAVARVVEHVQYPEISEIEGEQLELPPPQLYAMTQILAREDGTRYFGDNQQNFTNVTTGKALNNMFRQKIEWLAEGVRVGERYTAGYGAVITVGKGLSILAAKEVGIRGVVEEALNNAGEEYRKTFEQLALIRVTPNEEDKSEGDLICSHIEAGTLRGFSTIHRASAAGDPHFHAHIVLSSYAVPQYKRDPGDRTRKSIYSNQIMIGDDRVIDVAAQAARIKLYETLRENGININHLNGEIIYDEITRQTIQEFSKMRKMIEFITGEGIAFDDEQARILARQQMQHGGEGDPTPGWMGKEVGVSLGVCDPLRQQIQKWKNKTITVTVRGEEVTLNLSKVEQLEHVIDGLFLTGNADKAVEMWAEQLGGKDVWDELINNLYKASQTNNLTMKDYVEQLAAAAPRAKLTKKRLLNDSEAIAAALSFQEGRRITKEQVLAELELYFVYNPKTGWAEPTDTIKKDLEMGVGVKGVLQQVNTVEEALAITEGMAIISGVAGAGKTTAVAAAAEMWAESGGEEKTVWCVSRNSKTAMDLGNVVRDVFIRRWRLGGRTPGIQNMSLAKFRGEVGKGYGPRPGDRVIVDEYALAEREDFLLLTELAKSKRAVTMLGDPHQQEAIETPTAAQWVGELAKAFGQPVLNETKRCAGWKQQHDWLRAAPFDELARKAIIDDLVRDGNTEVVWDVRSLVTQAIQSGCDMILAIDNETVNLVAVEWRRQLWEASGRWWQVGEPTVKLRGEVDGYVGDSVRIRRIIYNKKGEQLARTGERGKIISIEGNIVEIEIRDGNNCRVIKIPTDLCGGVVSLGYASTIDSAQGMTCIKVGLVLKGMENSHAFYSGGSRGILFPKILIFNNIGDLGDGSQFLQPEIEPRIVLEQVLSRSNRSPDVENLDFYLSEFRRLGDKFGENLVIQLFENDLGADLIPPPPPQPPPPPVIQEPIQFGFEFEFGSAPVIPPPTPPPVVPTPTPQPPPSPVPTSVAQTVRELCEELLAYDVVDLTRIGEELIKNSGELLEYLQMVDAATREKIRRKLPPAVVGEIERRWREQQQATPITPVAAPQQPPAPAAAPVISPPGQVVIKRHVLLPEIQYIQRPSPSPVPTPQPPPSPTVVPPAPATTPQTVRELCASLLTSDVAGATRIGEELIKNVQEFATHWETLDSASRKIVLSKLPERIIREIERKLIKQQQNEREIEF